MRRPLRRSKGLRCQKFMVNNTTDQVISTTSTQAPTKVHKLPRKEESTHKTCTENYGCNTKKSTVCVIM
ncbi:hypothetical protein GWI33_019505 [Rhynchophorus ferrugineus]|uniref:Uncharacterized protein n=1 Tax=Rhynchophorus ferrugineus TaxID=354439 RepID=A0A834I584_RHYFE|nr:hypothetical protein GWI33_019505 [Rhynchophorus ferrugineus]